MTGPVPTLDEFLFVYGTLKPGQPGFRQIESHVSATLPVPAVLHNYELVERNGLPFALTCASSYEESDHSEHLIHGFLLHGHDLVAAAEEYEGSLYRKTNIVADAEGGPVRCVAFVQRKATKHRHRFIRSGVWSTRDDSLMADGIPSLLRHARQVVHDTRDSGEPEPPDPAYWSLLWQLQGAYLCLWTVLERFSMYRYGTGPAMANRIQRLDRDPEIQSVLDQLLPRLPVVSVFRSDESENHERNSHDGSPFDAWYSVRSNLTHQGKTPLGPNRDLRMLVDATESVAEVVETLTETYL